MCLPGYRESGVFRSHSSCCSDTRNYVYIQLSAYRSVVVWKPARTHSLKDGHTQKTLKQYESDLGINPTVKPPLGKYSDTSIKIEMDDYLSRSPG